ncbi:MAG: Rrf2 family transcriptional regulator [Acidimicrobiia bacterium]|nr:Rrf2 family transcriptional regulator [Acidimicrobiia bacterium]
MTAEPADPPAVVTGVRSLRVPARVDDALRALLVLAGAPSLAPVKMTELSRIEGLSPRFLSTVMVALRDKGLVHSQRGAAGGYWLARPADQITVSDVYDAVDVRDPVMLRRSRVTGALWNGLEAELRSRLAAITLADLLAAPRRPPAATPDPR